MFHIRIFVLTASDFHITSVLVYCSRLLYCRLTSITCLLIWLYTCTHINTTFGCNKDPWVMRNNSVTQKRSFFIFMYYMTFLMVVCYTGRLQHSRKPAYPDPSPGSSQTIYLHPWNHAQTTSGPRWGWLGRASQVLHEMCCSWSRGCGFKPQLG